MCLDAVGAPEIIEALVDVAAVIDESHSKTYTVTN